MNKLFTLIGAAALMAAVGAQAQTQTTTLYTATVNDGATALVETGGTCTLGSVLTKQSGYKAIKVGGSTDANVIVLADDATFKSGDVISFTGFINNADLDSKTGKPKSAVVKIFLDDKTTSFVYPSNDVFVEDETEKHKGFANLKTDGYNYVDGNPNTLTITLPNDASKITFQRNSGATGSATTMFITKIEITRTTTTEPEEPEEEPTSIESAEAGAPVSVEYYNVAGARVDGLQPGINIVRTTYEGGKVVTSKVRR